MYSMCCRGDETRLFQFTLNSKIAVYLIKLDKCVPSWGVNRLLYLQAGGMRKRKVSMFVIMCNW